ncbi:LysE family translocator [Gallibacterium anatis]|uniref:LysE family translocator n=1 Tax=Gallibacterium anatis TaxID=750 RepID=UPI00300606AB
MQEIIAVSIITILAVISPGGDFAMVTRNSYLYGLRAGIFTAIGIASAVWVHVAYTLLGVSVLLLQFPSLFYLIKALGACYLIVIGYQTFRHQAISVDEGNKQLTLMSGVAFRNGFVSNALNPKTTLFILSTFTQIVQTNTPITVQIGYGAFISLSHLIWFIFVAKVLSNPIIRDRLLRRQITVNRIIGAILIFLGMVLLFSVLNP